jgi:hypothetical protein
MNYKQDLRPENERKFKCAFCPRPAVVILKVSGVQHDVCERCWKARRS